MNTDYEKILTEKISMGEEGAFRALFNIYYPKVLTFITCIVKEQSDAEDIAQDIFVKIWERREMLPDHVTSLTGYIYRMSRNAALNKLRRSANLQYVSELDQHASDYSESASGTEIENEYYAREKALFIRLVVNRMPKQRRLIFEMSRYHGLDNQSIADILHISKKTVENHLSLALKELREALAIFAMFFFMQ